MRRCVSRACRLPHAPTGPGEPSRPDRVFTDAAIVAELRRIKTGGPDGRPLPEVLYGRRKMTAWLARHGFPASPSTPWTG